MRRRAGKALGWRGGPARPSPASSSRYLSNEEFPITARGTGRKTCLFSSNPNTISLLSRGLRTKGMQDNNGKETTQEGGRGRSVGGFGHLFDVQGANYDQFRPDYPTELYDAILRFAGFTPSERKLAVDLGCGTGQATKILAQHFQRVKGVDPSTKMLDNAAKADNIEYELGTCDRIHVADGSVDLLTTAQAAHWFDLDRFYVELRRVLRPGGVVAVWGYSLCHFDEPEATKILYKYHTEVIGPYWEPERKLLDAGYVHIDLPFPKKERVEILVKKKLSFNNFLGYINTQSALKTLREKNPGGPNPVLNLADECVSLRYTSYGLG